MPEFPTDMALFSEAETGGAPRLVLRRKAKERLNALGVALLLWGMTFFIHFLEGKGATMQLPLMFVSILAAVLTLLGIYAWFYKAVLYFEAAGLRIQNKPFPFLGLKNRYLPYADLELFYLHRSPSRTQIVEALNRNFSIRVKNKQGQDFSLLGRYGFNGFGPGMHRILAEYVLDVLRKQTSVLVQAELQDDLAVRVLGEGRLKEQMTSKKSEIQALPPLPVTLIDEENYGDYMLLKQARFLGFRRYYVAFFISMLIAFPLGRFAYFAWGVEFGSSVFFTVPAVIASLAFIFGLLNAFWAASNQVGNLIIRFDGQYLSFEKKPLGQFVGVVQIPISDIQWFRLHVERHRIERKNHMNTYRDFYVLLVQRRNSGQEQIFLTQKMFSKEELSYLTLRLGQMTGLPARLPE